MLVHKFQTSPDQSASNLLYECMFSYVITGFEMRDEYSILTQYLAAIHLANLATDK